MSFVELIAYYAAPTLEGMKPSCLFSCRDSEVGNVEEFVLAYNRCLNPKRIYLQIMKHSPDFKLILVYHKDLLDTHLCQEDIQQFLSAFGYGFVTTRQALYHLQEHMCKECFPHEIGVFLGYPLDDVVSFIQNNGKNYQEIGYWKIYHNPLPCEKNNGTLSAEHGMYSGKTAGRHSSGTADNSLGKDGIT